MRTLANLIRSSNPATKTAKVGKLHLSQSQFFPKVVLGHKRCRCWLRPRVVHKAPLTATLGTTQLPAAVVLDCAGPPRPLWGFVSCASQDIWDISPIFSEISLAQDRNFPHVFSVCPWYRTSCPYQVWFSGETKSCGPSSMVEIRGQILSSRLSTKPQKRQKGSVKSVAKKKQNHMDGEMSMTISN